MFNENVKRIEDKLLPFIEQLRAYREHDDFQDYSLVDTRAGVPTLRVKREGKNVFLHSKYNPIQESERIVNDYEDVIAEKDHIIFYGVGLGFHVESILSRSPNKKYTLIEPDAGIFARFLESRTLSKFPFENMSTIYIPVEKVSLKDFLLTLSMKLKGDVSVVVFPAYERLYKKELNDFYKAYQESLKATKSNVVATKAFGKRWTLNSLMNISTTLTTQNIKEKAVYFKDKPIVIASAGPSLYDDLENFKHIKEKGLAYIFAVGSANKAFLSYGIAPDAVLTYDPQPHNVNVFKELIASGRTDIPMIYGTSVGFETIETYQGPKFHLVNSADSVTNFYLNKNRDEYDVHDSTTIALIAIQVAELLGAGSVILAGQNLAFKENRYYATGIEHGQWKGEVRKDKEGKEIHTATDVYGNLIETNESLMGMKKDIEYYLESYPHIKVINSTKGGADIKGAPFEPIEQLIKERLTTKIVDEQWFIDEPTSLTKQAYHQVSVMERAIDNMYEVLDACRTILQRLDSLKRTNKVQQINKLFTDFDKQFDRLIANDFYTCFIASILQSELEQLYKTIHKSYVAEQVEKINIITSSNMLFFGMVQEIFSEMVVHVKEMMHPKLLQVSTEWKTYKHNDGVFQFEGEWERETLTFNDLSRTENNRKISRTISTKSMEKGAKITFKFEGTALQLFAQKHADFSNEVKVTIDGKEQMIKTKDRKLKDGLSTKLQQTVFEAKALQNKMHEVSIELLSYEPFHFQGISINRGGRIYHTDEVATIEALKIGKRIRCHYEATINKVGTFDELGETNRSFIPVEATPEPNGDFYFIMVDEVDGKKKLIADRNLQNYISFETIINRLIKETGIKGNINTKIRLLNVSEDNQGTDEWLKYLQDSRFNGAPSPEYELVWNLERNVDEGRGMYSFIQYENGNPGVYGKCYHREQEIINENRNVRVSDVNRSKLWGFRPKVIIS